jgi:hypothetical protein
VAAATAAAPFEMAHAFGRSTWVPAAGLIARLGRLDHVEKQLGRAKAAAHLDELRAQVDYRRVLIPAPNKVAEFPAWLCAVGDRWTESRKELSSGTWR